MRPLQPMRVRVSGNKERGGRVTDKVAFPIGAAIIGPNGFLFKPGRNTPLWAPEHVSATGRHGHHSVPPLTLSLPVTPSSI